MYRRARRCSRGPTRDVSINSKSTCTVSESVSAGQTCSSRTASTAITLSMIVGPQSGGWSIGVGFCAMILAPLSSFSSSTEFSRR